MITITVEGVPGPLAAFLMSDPQHGVQTLTRTDQGYTVTGYYPTPLDASRMLLAVHDAKDGEQWPSRKSAWEWLRGLPRSTPPARRHAGTIPAALDRHQGDETQVLPANTVAGAFADVTSHLIKTGRPLPRDVAGPSTLGAGYIGQDPYPRRPRRTP
jgi:hypothetical protein